MKIVEAGYVILPFSLEDEIVKKVELCGRTCYQSHDKMSEGSSGVFSSMILKNGHLSVLEHGTIMVNCSVEMLERFNHMPVKNRRFFKTSTMNGRNIVSANIRAWIEAKDYINSKLPEVLDELKNQYDIYFGRPSNNNTSFRDTVKLIKFVELTKAELYVHYRPTVKFVSDRGFMAEIRTHRDASFSVESTRYVNYNTEKNDKQITVIEPFFLDGESYSVWSSLCERCEDAYNHMINLGRSPQEARSVLPLSLKTEIICTANYDEWEHIFELRCASAAHPQMRQLMEPLRNEMNNFFK